jgi:DNA-binding transcriptional LysR family regulator
MHISTAWHGVELRHFTALEAVFEESSFNRAAARLGYTPSAISQQIATLERAVGQKLVERRTGPAHPVRFTEAGDILLAHAHAIRARLATAQADLEAYAAGELAPLRIGAFQSIGWLVLPPLLQAFREAHPTTAVALTESHHDSQFFDQLRLGELDVAFVHLPILPGPFLHRSICEDDYVLLVRNDSALARRRAPLSLAEIAALPLVGSLHCRSIDRVTAHFRSRGLELDFVLRSDDSATVQGFVAGGVGAALVPRLVARSASADVVPVEIQDGPPRRQIGLAWSAERTNRDVIDSFVATVSSVVDATRSAWCGRSAPGREALNAA